MLLTVTTVKLVSGEKVTLFVIVTLPELPIKLYCWYMFPVPVIEVVESNSSEVT